MANESCELCGKSTPSYNTIYISLEDRHKCVCLPCYNKDMSEAVGVDYDHMELQPIIMSDVDGNDHTFHFAVRLIGETLIIEAFELFEGQPAGYTFQTGGDVEDGLFSVFSKLHERMLRALSRKHVERNSVNDSWQISRDDTGEDVIRAQITSDQDSMDSINTPLIIVDGKEIKWEKFGKMLMTYEGFNFKLQIYDPSDEMD